MDSFAGCSSLDVAISNKFNSHKTIEKIVVFPFQIDGAKCGSEFADAVSHQFIKSGKFDVVEREALDKLIDEEKLSLSGVIDESKAATIGKIITQMMSIPPVLPPGVPNPAFIPSRIAGALSIASTIASTAKQIQQINQAAASAGAKGGGSVAVAVVHQTYQCQQLQEQQHHRYKQLEE